ncbi:MAG: aldolase catalytic domain-containing protein [Allomuricauda sp.]
MKRKVKILDCTLRDGGYYTNWDFDKELVNDYCACMEELPIEYIEIGYRSISLEGYLGEYFYCPEYLMKELKEKLISKKLCIILDEKNIRQSDVKKLLTPCIPYISMVRMAVDPKNIERAILLAREVKNMGFEVAFNLMYMSSWKNNNAFLEKLGDIDGVIDYFYMVDSFGGMLPKDIKETIQLVKSKTNTPLGFHGHNNLEAAFINTLTAIQEGCDIVDSTITGMGRGAGNLRTELLLTHFESQNLFKIKFGKLSNIVGEFEKLKKEYNWGTNLPYMFSGAFSLPQKQVMEWVGMNRYSIGNIINALNNQKDSCEDNMKLPVLEKRERFETAIILGGGKSAKKHRQAIMKLAESKEKICLIHAGARNINNYLELKGVDQFCALVGFETEKLLKIVDDVSQFNHTYIYPPFPRAMGTLIPEEIKKRAKELETIRFTEKSKDSPMALGFQIALDLGVKKVFLAGFDGYDTSISQTQFALAQENQNIINDAVKGLEVISITPTKYKKLDTISIYSIV